MVFELLALFDEPFRLAHLRNHPLYTKEEITYQDLEQLDLLLLSVVHCLGVYTRKNQSPSP
jgi:LysR family hydrogen peroxide-inducible transcriptional activator